VVLVTTLVRTVNSSCLKCGSTLILEVSSSLNVDDVEVLFELGERALVTLAFGIFTASRELVEHTVVANFN